MRQPCEVWLHFRWPPGTDYPIVFSAHETEESARLDCPVDLVTDDGWMYEGAAPLGDDPYLVWALEDYLQTLRELAEQKGRAG
jgi:hypothetical protein